MEKKLLLDDFLYPDDFLRIVNQNLINFDPWVILFDDELKERYLGMKSRYPMRNLIPFARRWDNDDVACFDISNQQKIHIIHDFAKAGWEEKKQIDSVWEWLKSVIDDMMEYEP